MGRCPCVLFCRCHLFLLLPFPPSCSPLCLTRPIFDPTTPRPLAAMTIAGTIPSGIMTLGKGTLSVDREMYRSLRQRFVDAARKETADGVALFQGGNQRGTKGGGECVCMRACAQWRRSATRSLLSRRSSYHIVTALRTRRCIVKLENEFSKDLSSDGGRGKRHPIRNRPRAAV